MKLSLIRLFWLCLVAGVTSYLFADSIDSVSVLNTPNYRITIDVKCAEGNVTCNNVIYTGINKTTKKAVRLRGTTLHTTCADRITPCQFVGYQFKNKNIIYYVDEDGTLEVIKNNKILLLQETGQWSYK